MRCNLQRIYYFLLLGEELKLREVLTLTSVVNFLLTHIPVLLSRYSL